MAKRKTATVNPHIPRSPYPDETPRNTGMGKIGWNTFGQGDQTSRGSVSMPWPEGARSDSHSPYDEDEDYGDRRRPLPGRSISGRY